MPTFSFAPSLSMACLQCNARPQVWQAKLLPVEELLWGGAHESCTRIGNEIRNIHDFGTR